MTNPYETPELVHQYLLFHYGEPEEVLPWPEGPHTALDFARRIVSENLFPELLPDEPTALDLGCAVGGSSFELARTHHRVLGIDYSQAFVDCAAELAHAGQVNYRIPECGDLARPAVARVPDNIDRSRVSFEQGDACDLREDLGAFDTVLAANLLCRLPHPAECLKRLRTLVNPGGQVIFTTPSTWMTEFTPKTEWLGGYEGETGPVQTLDGIRAVIGGSFTLLKRQDMPFLIREHARKFQWSVAEASVWQRHQD